MASHIPYTESELRDRSLDGSQSDLSRLLAENKNLAETTANVYASSWLDFREWCENEGREPLPADPETVVQFLDDRSDLAKNTLKNRVSAIGAIHEQCGYDNPTKNQTVGDKRRLISKRKEEEEDASIDLLSRLDRNPSEVLKGGAPMLQNHLASVFDSDRESREKSLRTWTDEFMKVKEASSANLTEKQKDLIPKMEWDIAVMRDRALLLFLASVPASRSHAVRANLEDVFVDEDDVLLGIRDKKGNPSYTARLVKQDEEELCPLQAICAWIVAGELSSGAVFRSFTTDGEVREERLAESSVNRIVNNAAKKAGLNEADWTPSRLKKTPDDS